MKANIKAIVWLWAEKVISGEVILDEVPEKLRDEIIEAVEELKPIYNDDGK